MLLCYLRLLSAIAKSKQVDSLKSANEEYGRCTSLLTMGQKIKQRAPGVLEGMGEAVQEECGSIGNRLHA